MERGLAAATAFVHGAIQKGGAVVIHCAAGASRSTTVALAFLLLHKQATAPHPQAPPRPHTLERCTLDLPSILTRLFSR